MPLHSLFRSPIALLAAAGLFSVACCQPVAATLTDAEREQMVAEIKAAATDLDASRLPDYESARPLVLDQISAVKSFFGTNTSGDNEQSWLDYLELDPLHQALTEGSEVPVIGREAVALRYRLIGTHEGLELEPLTKLRDNLSQLIDSLRFRNKEKAIEGISKQLESLASRISQLDASPSSGDIAAISALVASIHSSGQAPGAITAVRNTFDHPNVAILISEGLVQEAVHQDVVQTRPVYDCILGTRIVGQATMNGVVSADLLPATGSVRLEVSLAGTVTSNNTGYNGPVRLRTVGCGDVTATRIVNFDDSGVHMEPTQVQAALRTDIRAIEHKMRLVRNIARKKAAQQKPRADRIALSRMRRQVADNFTQRTDDALAGGPPGRLDNLRSLLQRLSLSEPSRAWTSTSDWVSVDSVFRTGDQLSTVVSPPNVDADFGALFQVHESVINNAFSPVLAGRTLKESQLNRLMKAVGRDMSSPQKEGEPTEPSFEISFASLQPIVFEARDQKIRIGVRGTKFTQGRRELKRSMEITAIYQVASTEEGKLILVRDGEVEVNFPGRKRLTVTQAGLKPAIQTKFSKVFPETLLDRSMEISQEARIKSLRGRVFETALVDASSGWLSVGLK